MQDLRPFRFRQAFSGARRALYTSFTPCKFCKLKLLCCKLLSGRFRLSHTSCQARTTETQTPSKEQLQKRDRLTRSQEVPDLPAPRSPFNTGSMDITTAGATASLCGHDLPSEKTIIIVRHGLTTWNEQSRIQASSRPYVLAHANRPVTKPFAGSRELQMTPTSHLMARSKPYGLEMLCPG